MSNSSQTWDLPDYGAPSLSESLFVVNLKSPKAEPARVRGQQGRKVGEGLRVKVRRRASARFTFVLTLVTSAIAVVDLFLLSTTIPH